MLQTLTVSEITNIVGVEEDIVRHTLERRDEDLTAYLHEPRTNQSSDASTEGENVNHATSQPQTPLLHPEGLPLLITKLAFNIPTSDIIENLACQVLHLMLIQQEKTELAVKNQELQQQNEQLQQHIKELQQKAEVLQTELTEQIEAASRRTIWNLFGRRKPESTKT